MLAVVEGLEDHTSCGLKRTRHFHKCIDGLAGGQYRRVVSQHRDPPGNCRLCLSSRCCTAPLRDPGLPECTLSMLRGPICNRNEANPRYRCCELQGDGAACRTRSNHAYAN